MFIKSTRQLWDRMKWNPEKSHSMIFKEFICIMVQKISICPITNVRLNALYCNPGWQWQRSNISWRSSTSLAHTTAGILTHSVMQVFSRPVMFFGLSLGNTDTDCLLDWGPEKIQPRVILSALTDGRGQNAVVISFVWAVLARFFFFPLCRYFSLVIRQLLFSVESIFVLVVYWLNSTLWLFKLWFCLALLLFSR